MINLDAHFQNAKETYDNCKNSYDEATFVTRSNCAICCNCGKQSTKAYMLALRCLNTKRCPWNSLKVKGNHKFHKSYKNTIRCKYCNSTKGQTQRAEYKIITWVCSKPCETMMMLKLI